MVPQQGLERNFASVMMESAFGIDGKGVEGDGEFL